MGAGGSDRGVRNTVAGAAGAPEAGPSIKSCTGPGAGTAGPGAKDGVACRGGGTTGFSALRELCCLWKTRCGVVNTRARLQGEIPQAGRAGDPTPATGLPRAHLSGRRSGEDGGHGVGSQVAHAPSPLEARGGEMLAAQVLVAAGHPVLTAHVPQPGLQPGAILQREPARGARSAMSGPTPAPTAPPPHRALSAKPLPPSGQSLAMPPNQVVCGAGGGRYSLCPV